MHPFHVVHLAVDTLDDCRRRTGQMLHHRHRRAVRPLYMSQNVTHPVMPAHTA